jgi:hypothetical protein
MAIASYQVFDYIRQVLMYTRIISENSLTYILNLYLILEVHFISSLITSFKDFFFDKLVIQTCKYFYNELNLLKLSSL